MMDALQKKLSMIKKMGKKKFGRHFINSLKILKKALAHFKTNNPIGMAGTTAYFTIFSIAPILIIIIAVFGLFASGAMIREKLFGELGNLIGHESTELLQTAISNYQIIEKSGFAAVIGVVIFLFSATTLFSIMQNSINYIWRIRVKPKLKLNLLKLARDRLFSFGMILSLGLVLLISLMVEATVGLLHDYLSELFDAKFLVSINMARILVSLLLTTSVFAFIYRFLPDVTVRWKASWFGAIFATLLFFLGKYLIGFIIGNSQLGVIYGAASSLIILLLWVYYVSLIFYFGVEICYQYSNFFGHDQKPLKFAEPFKISKAE
jgi:membrane protein